MMLSAHHDLHRVPAPRVAPPAPPLPAPAPVETPRATAATADTPLARTLARAVQHRAQVQRAADDSWMGSMYDAFGNAVGNLYDATGQAFSNAGNFVSQTVGDAASFVTGSNTAPAPAAVADPGPTVGMPKPSYSTWDSTTGPARKPDTSAWFDNPGLEAVRSGGELLARNRVPRGGDQGATKLVKQAVQAVGSEQLGVDLLPKAGTGGPFGPETAAAVTRVQSLYGLSADGMVGPKTVNALDGYVGG